MADEAKLRSPIPSTSEALELAVCTWCCHGEELGPLCDQCWLQALQFLVHLISLLSILLTCHGFTGIKKAVVDQTGSRLPSSDHDPF